MKRSNIPYTVSGYEKPYIWSLQAEVPRDMSNRRSVEHFTPTSDEQTLQANDIHLNTDQVIITQVDDTPESNVPQIIPETRVLQGYDINGFDMPRMPITKVADHDACYKLCLKDPQCHLLAYNKNNGDCWLKSGRKVKQVTTQGEGFYYGDTDLPYFDMPNMPLKNIAGSDECLDQCKKTENCHWVNYNQSNRDCWLKQAHKLDYVSTQFKPAKYAPPVAAVETAKSQVATPVWGVNKSDGIFYREGITPETPSGKSWKQVDGALTAISIGPKGQVWGCNRQTNIFFRDGPNGVWQRIEGGLVDISVGSNNEVWGVAYDGTIWYRAGITPENLKGTSWLNVDGQLTRISTAK
jgi:hypothetical protein